MKIEKLKIGSYVLTFDTFFKKSTNIGGEEVCVDHCKGAKTFKSAKSYNRFYNYLIYMKCNNSIYRDIIYYDDFVIYLTHDAADSLTISYEMYNGREMMDKYVEITENYEDFN